MGLAGGKAGEGHCRQREQWEPRYTLDGSEHVEDGKEMRQKVRAGQVTEGLTCTSTGADSSRSGGGAVMVVMMMVEASGMHRRNATGVDS